MIECEAQKLRECGVRFEQDEHRYFLGVKELGGITSLLARQLFPNKYAGIPDSILEKAKQYGSMVHEHIELSETMGLESNLQAVADFKRLMSSIGRKVVYCEWLVTDGENYASAIDQVLDDCSLVDTKTTAKLDIDYVTWQLSIYAYLLELNNKDVKVGKLYCAWLPNPKYKTEAKLVEIKRLPDSEIIGLLEADKKHEQYVPNVPIKASTNNALALTTDAIDLIIANEKTIAQCISLRDEYNAKLKSSMDKGGIKKAELNGMTITRCADSTRTTTSYDIKNLLEDHPELEATINLYKTTKTTATSGSLKIKLKDEIQ